MKRQAYLLSLVALLTVSAPAQAAFIVKQPITITGAAPVKATVAGQQDANYATPTSDIKAGKTKNTKQPKKGYGLGAFIVGLVGVGTGILAISLIPVSIIGAILLGALTILLGIIAIGSAVTDKKSILPRRGYATIGLILGIIESAPLIIPVGLVAFFYHLFGGGKHNKNK